MKGMNEKISGLTGFLGSAFAALCCIGFSVLVGALGAIGAGFLVNDRYLIPLLIIFLVISLYGFFVGYKKRHNPWTLGIGVFSAFVILVSILFTWRPGVYGGLTALLFATAWNIWNGLSQHHHGGILRR